MRPTSVSVAQRRVRSAPSELFIGLLTSVQDAGADKSEQGVMQACAQRVVRPVDPFGLGREVTRQDPELSPQRVSCEVPVRPLGEVVGKTHRSFNERHVNPRLRRARMHGKRVLAASTR